MQLGGRVGQQTILYPNICPKRSTILSILLLMFLSKPIFSCSVSKRAFFKVVSVKLSSKNFRFLGGFISSTIDISESLNGVIGDAIPMSIPPWTPSNNSFPLIDLSLASSSVSSASGDPPPVLRADNTLSLIMGLCLANTLDHYLETSSLLLKVPCDCEISLAISSQTLFFSSKVKEQLKAPKSLDLFSKTKSTSEDISSDEKFFARVFIDISNSKGD